MISDNGHPCDIWIPCFTDPYITKEDCIHNTCNFEQFWLLGKEYKTIWGTPILYSTAIPLALHIGCRDFIIMGWDTHMFHRHKDKNEANRIYGDLLGFATAILIGGSAVVIRYGKVVNFLPALLLSKIFTMIIALLFIQSMPMLLEGKNTYLIIDMGILCVFLPMTLLTLAPRYIPAYEVEIFFVLETILGPIWVWLIVHEQPSTKTIIGGICIIFIILAHTLSELSSRVSHKH